MFLFSFLREHIVDSETKFIFFNLLESLIFKNFFKDEEKSVISKIGS